MRKPNKIRGADDITEEVVEDATKVVKQPLLVGQIRAMSGIVAKYAQNALSYEQAKNQLIIGIGLTEE